MDDTNDPKPTKHRGFARSAEADILINLLSEAEPGELVTKEAMSRAIARNIDHCRAPLQTARKVLRDEKGIVFRPESGQGLVRLREGEKYTIGSDLRKRFHRASKKAVREMATADMDALDEGGKKQLLDQLSIAGAYAAATSHRAANRFLKSSEAAVKEVPPAAVLEALKG